MARQFTRRKREIISQPAQETMGEIQQCIQTCLDCHRICLETMQHCLQMEGKYAELSHIRLLLDCAEICRTSADFMIRGSDLYPYICDTCAEVCKQCAEDCEQISSAGDEIMARCADLCNRCAKSCLQMATA